jgi:hypothetical protein
MQQVSERGLEAWGINVFRYREELLRALRGGERLPALVWRMALGSFLCATLYGAVLGAQIGGWQLLASPVKLPLVLLGTAGICMAALYVLLAWAGERFNWLQVAALALCCVTASALCMAAFLPVTAFWTLCFQGGNRTPIILIHSGAFFVAGVVGTRFGLEITYALFATVRPRRVMVVWMWLFGLVAQQMAWIFRPHFHPTTYFMAPFDGGGSALQRLFQIVVERLFG